MRKESDKETFNAASRSIELINLEELHPDWMEHTLNLASGPVYRKRITDFFGWRNLLIIKSHYLHEDIVKYWNDMI